MKFRIISMALFLAVYSLHGQNSTPTRNAETNIPVSQILNKQPRIGFPFSTLNWEGNKIQRTSGEYFYSVTSQIDFNSIGVGWSSTDDNILASDYQLFYRYFENNKNEWSDWRETHGETKPDESPTNFYWSHLILTDNLVNASKLQIKLMSPKGIDITSIRIDISNISNLGTGTPVKQNKNINNRNAACPVQPTILQRSDWWGSLPANELSYPNATNTKTPEYNTSTTHAFIHHGASSNTYTDGAAVIRGYWSYHVNTKGWKDIGYNYVMDKFGNLYIARYNPRFPQEDVLGAHTSSSNPYSFAVCFAGDYTTTQPTQVSLDKLYDFLAWKCNLRGMDPTGTGFIVSKTIDIISGHRDAPDASTTCPGDMLYAQLPNIRTTAKGILNLCTDKNPPVTIITPSGGWKTTNFQVNFTDTDNESGVAQSFYQVLDNNGIEWRANGGHGFFNDNFDAAVNPEWTRATGTWTINAAHLNQTNDAISNSNIYAAVAQNNANKYLYHWQMSIGGSGTNRRAGIHFFSNNASLSERGNSYFIYFRADNNKVQIYKVVNNTWTLQKETDLIVSPNTWYDYKIIFDPASGIIKAFQNDLLAAEWTDPSPHQTAGYISLRTGNCNVLYDDVKVYKSRTTIATVSIGTVNSEIRFQNSSLTSEAGRIKSVIIDNMNNWSAVASENIMVDWSSPASIANVNDGTSSDMDTTYDATQLSANWSSALDPNSGIKEYQYAIGTTSGGSNLIGWTTTGTAISMAKIGLALQHGQKYYVSVRAQNGAGIWTVVKASDGILYLNPALIIPSYCKSQGSNPNYEWIAGVKAGTINNSSVKSSYTDFSAVTGNFEQGKTYAISLTPGFGSTTYSEYWRIWIDLNNDGTFAANELLFDPGILSKTTVTGNISIPLTAPLGKVRMRVSMKYNGAPTPCETFSYGEVEDYTANIITPTVSYCASKGSNSYYEWIEKIAIGGFSKISGNNNGYVDFTQQVIQISNISTSISLTPGFRSTTYNEYWKIWIDINDDGDFTDVGEQVFDAINMSKSTVTGNLILPLQAKIGKHRMRIIMKYNGAPSSCETFSYGEVEDYTAEIIGTAKQITSVEDLSQTGFENFRIYPNPAIGNFVFVEYDNSLTNAQHLIQIFDITGKLMGAFSLNRENYIDISDFESGVYHVVYLNGTVQRNQKLVIIR